MRICITKAALQGKMMVHKFEVDSDGKGICIEATIFGQKGTPVLVDRGMHEYLRAALPMQQFDTLMDKLHNEVDRAVFLSVVG